MNLANRRVVITGLGPVTPIGIGKEEFWDNLVECNSNFGEITRVELQEWDRVRIAAEINNFDPADYVDERTLAAVRKVSPRGGMASWYALAAARLGAKDANLDLQEMALDRVGVIMGTGAGDLEIMRRGEGSFIRAAFALGNTPAAFIARDLGTRGICQGVSAACATGNIALSNAYDKIVLGHQDLLFVGSTETPINAPFYLGTEHHRRNGQPALSQRVDARGPLPFDADRDGTVLSEGASVLVLEELEHALARDAEIYCEVLGYGDHTWLGKNLVEISEEGYSLAMRNAIKSARIADDLASMLCASKVYINAHGSGTIKNDQVESAAIKKLFDSKAPVSSFKGTIGHVQAASSAGELVGSVLTLSHGVIPKSNLKTPASDCAKLDYVCAAREQSLELVLKNAAGFGGAYSTVVLGRYQN